MYMHYEATLQTREIYGTSENGLMICAECSADALISSVDSSLVEGRRRRSQSLRADPSSTTNIRYRERIPRPRQIYDNEPWNNNWISRTWTIGHQWRRIWICASMPIMLSVRGYNFRISKLRNSLNSNYNMEMKWAEINLICWRIRRHTAYHQPLPSHAPNLSFVEY